jgi:hypothetical protein
VFRDMLAIGTTDSRSSADKKFDCVAIKRLVSRQVESDAKPASQLGTHSSSPPTSMTRISRRQQSVVWGRNGDWKLNSGGSQTATNGSGSTIPYFLGYMNAIQQYTCSGIYTGRRSHRLRSSGHYADAERLVTLRSSEATHRSLFIIAHAVNRLIFIHG